MLLSSAGQAEGRETLHKAMLFGVSGNIGKKRAFALYSASKWLFIREKLQWEKI